MRIAAFVGSPRAEGVTDALVREILTGAEEAGADTALFHIGLLHISGCHACLKCMEKGACVLDDDMQPLFKEIRDADCLILGTPIYFFYMTAQMKAFTDRLFSIIDRGIKSRIGRKKAIFTVTQGAEGKDTFKDQIRSMIEAWSFAGIDVEDTIQACGFENSEQVTRDTELMKRAFSMGRDLVARST